MGLFSDAVRSLERSAPEQPGEFTKGMRSGGNAAMASLNNLAGAVGQKVGADDFAAGRFTAADQYTQDAAASAPRVASMRDIHGVADFADYAKGLAGGMVPVGGAALGATLLTGGGAVPAMLAGTGVMAPVEAGDIVGRMREQGQPIDLTRAAVGGVGSAALQNVLPGVARARLGGTAGRLPGGALANIPEQAVLAGGSELGKQQAANAGAPLDWAQAGEAAAGGAVMGVPIAGMTALGDNRAAIGSAVGAVGDAAKALSSKAKDVAQATGDKATAGADAAVQHVKGVELGEALTGLYDDAKVKAKGALDQIAKSDDVIGDITKFAGLQGDKLKQALLGNDGERLNEVKAYAKELGDQHPAVRDWLTNVGDHGKQAAVAAAKVAKAGMDDGMAALKSFADAASKRADGLATAAKGAVKKSEDDSGVRQALAQKLIPELLKARPDLAELAGDPEVATQLHRGFAPLIEDLANGRKPSSDTIARLIDLAGGHADRLVEAAHSVVGDSTDQAKTREFFSGLNQFTQVRDNSDKLTATMRKSLVKGAERHTTDRDLREEARLLQQWRDDKRPVSGPNADPEAQRLDYTVRKHLDARYGAKSEAVLAALEKARPEEANKFERARVKYDEDGQPIDSGVDDGFSETGSPNGRMQFFGGGRKGVDLLLHPDDDPGKNGFPGAAARKLERVKAAHPDSTPRFVTATEMGLDHPWVKEKYKVLVQMGNESGLDGERFARENLDRYGVIATERSIQKTQLSFDELDAMKLDRKRYADSASRIDAGDGVVLDAVKITRSMVERFKDEPYTPLDDRSRVARLGRMFIEGIAATQDYLGRSFDIPDSTVLGKLDSRPVTWADVKKLDTRTAQDRANDNDTKYLTELRRQFKATEDKALRAEIAKDAAEVAGPREARKNKELGSDEGRGQLDDALDFEGDVERGINVDKSTLRAQVRGVLAQIETVGKLLDGEAQFGLGAEEVKLRQQLARLTTQLDALRARQEKMTPGESLGSGQREIDPFGQIHQAAGYSARREPAPINTDSGEKRGPFLPQRINEPVKAEGPPDDLPPPDSYDEGTPGPKAVAAKKAAFLERARSGDETLIRDIKQHSDAVGLQNAVVHLARKGDVHAPGIARAIDALNERIGELVKSDPQQAYDMLRTDRSGKKYSLEQTPEDTNDRRRGLITRLADDRRARFVDAPVSGRHRLDAGADSFGPLGKNFSYYFENDGTRTHTAVIPNEFVPRLERYLANHPDPAQRANALGFFSVQHVAYEHGTGDLQTFGPRPNAPGGELLAKLGALGDTGRVTQSGDAVARVEGVSDRDAARVLAMALAWSKHTLGKDELPVSWTRITGANQGREGSGTFSMEPADPNRQGPINRKEVRDYIKRTLGNSVQLAWERLGHAGEFERIERPSAPIEDVIRLSIHAMNPLSTAFHESMHGFIQQLKDRRHGTIVDVLFKAGESAPILNQLRAWMAERGMGEAALAQLKDPEERAAYMYQAWADGKLKVGDQTKTVLGKIADFIRSVLGVWSNDQRALHIMEYFHSGEYARNMGDRTKVYNDLMLPGRNKAIETARKMTQPILDLGENLGVAGGQRLRDTGIPALRELADMMKLHTVAEGDDVGFVPAARAERTRVMNKLAADLKDTSAEGVQAALESLQQQSNAPIAALATPEERLAARQAKATVRKLLDGVYQYMTDAGVKVNDLGVGKDYFPRVYDTSYISANQQEFKNVLTRHGVKDAEKTLAKIMVAEGAEFTTVTDKPGMQHLKPRDLAHIPEAELAPFMRKDLPSILNGYVTQATRRAEWAKRFKDDGSVITDKLIEAKRQGATPDDLDSARKFVQAVDGTLGDTINPEARRLFGNMIVYQNVRLLPLMIFSSVVDPMGIMVRGGTMGDAFSAFKRGVAEIPKNFKKSPTDDAATKFAASIGVIDDTALMHTLGALYSQGMVGDTGRKINDTLFRYNLAEQFNTSMRVSATEAAMGFLTRHADGTESPHSRRWLSELGLQPGELKTDANGRIKVTEADGLTAAESIKVKAAINRWVDGAVLRPDAVDKPLWMSDPHFSLIAHLKQFTYSFHETILKRVAHEYQNGNYTPAMALASYVPIMIAADMAKGMIQGGGDEPSWKQNWGVADYVESGIERAGLLGVGQFGVDMLRDAVRGGTGIGALAGPTIEQFAEAAKMLGGRESFGQFALKGMPANALYAASLGGEATDPKFVD